MSRPFKILALALCLFAPGVQAHEFWIEPELYQIPAGGEARASFHVGQNFKGPSYGYFEGRAERFDVVIGGVTQPVASMLGNDPALQMGDAPEGLLVVVHETRDMDLSYSEIAKWEKFRDHKALATDGVEHPVPFKEVYRRYAKALIGVGSGAGADAPTGMRTEIVALANPYTDDLSGGFPVQVLFEGAPRAGAQVELFEKAGDGSVEIRLYTTDAEGRALLAVKSGHSYLADAVTLLPLAANPAEGPVWYTLWAALTFAAP